MSRYIFSRFLGAIPTIFIIITISFILIRSAPGGPFDFDQSLPKEVQENLIKKYQLDAPLHQQYFSYLSGIVSGDFGPSYHYKDHSVMDLIKSGFPVSLQIGLSAILLSIVIGIVAGVYAAYRQNSWVDHGIMSFAILGVSIPSFVVAPLLVLFFAVSLQWLPAGGWEGGAFANQILPIITLALPQIAYVARITRSSMLEVLSSSFIRTAYSKGLSSRIILFKHALKPACLPVVSYLGPAIAGVITGSVIVEQIFNIPGLGRHFVQGALNRDYNLVMGVVLFYGILIIAFNLVVDILYAWLDPRIRLHQESGASSE